MRGSGLVVGGLLVLSACAMEWRSTAVPVELVRDPDRLFRVGQADEALDITVRTIAAWARDP